MTDAWSRIDHVLHAALLRPAHERDRFLRHECAGDTALEHEVRTLLAADAQAGSFLEEPAMQVAARALAGDSGTDQVHRIEPLDKARPALSPGSRLGPYEITAPIGAGGMGEVYRAVDTNLARHVAIKVLREAVAADPDRLARFDQEARTLAALNHPNIATIYGLERSGGIVALVMELVEGVTLAERIAQGALPVSDALAVASQIAAALEAAHEQGIVHRDLKPANIKLRPDGTVKVLDFGLARQMATPAPDALLPLDQSLTGVGRFAGTPAYMAPEQVEGNVSTGTDLFAFGLVLYEMLNARRPFPKTSLGGMLARGTDAVIQPPCQARSRIAGRLNALILALLDRDPARRPASAAAVRQQLLALQKPGHGRTAIAAAAIATALVLAAAWWFSDHRAPTRRLPHASNLTMLTTYAGNETMPSVSPDGALVAFSWAGEDGQHQDIYVMSSDGQEEPRRLTHDTSPDTWDVFPAWSPDRKWIAFVRRRGDADGELIVIPVQGGPERRLRDIRFESIPASSWLAWTPDGAQIAFASRSPSTRRMAISLLRMADGTVRSITAPPNGGIGDASPSFSPDGRSLAFVRWSSPSTSTLLVQKVDDAMNALKEPVTVRVAASAPQSPVWADNRRLFFSDGTRILEWEAGVPAEQVYLSDSRLVGIAIAGRGTAKPLRIVAAHRAVPPSRIWTIPLRAPGVPEGPPAFFARLGYTSNNPDYSPDGTRIVFVSQRSGTPELWMTDADGRNPRQLTWFGVARLGVPKWSPDNRHVAFFARVGGTEPQIYVIDASEDRPVPRQVTYEEPGCEIPSWSRSGTFLYCFRRVEGSQPYLYRVLAASGGKGESHMERWFEGKSATETSDDRVLYIKNNRFGLFARSLAGDPAANAEVPLVDDIKGPIGYFAPVAQGIYYTGQDSKGNYAGLRFFDYAQKRSLDVVPASTTGSVNSLTVTPDGSRLVYTKNSKDGIDLNLIEFK